MAAVRADGSGDRDDGLRIAAASLCAPHARGAAELPGRYARLLRRLEALAVELEAAPDPRTEPRGLRLVGNLPIAWPYLGYAPLPLTRRLGRLYAAADRAWAGGIAAHVLERRGEPTPVLRKPRVVIVAELGANTSPGLLFHGVFVGLAAQLRNNGLLFRRTPRPCAGFWGGAA